MARIRSVKPEFFTDELVSTWPFGTRLTYIGLWTHADDKGRAVDNAALMVAALWPLTDEYTAERVEHDLARMASDLRICRYEAGGKRLLHVLRWDHQRINRPSDSRLPPCPLGEDSLSHTEALTEPSLSPHVALTPRAPADLDLDLDQGSGSGKGSGVAKTRDDVEKLCTLLADLIEKNGSNRPRIGKTWRDECRRMLDLDNRPPELAEQLIHWCQADGFWRANILSMPTFREKFDKIRLKADAPAANGHKPYTNPTSPDAYTEAL